MHNISFAHNTFYLLGHKHLIYLTFAHMHGINKHTWPNKNLKGFAFNEKGNKKNADPCAMILTRANIFSLLCIHFYYYIWKRQNTTAKKRSSKDIESIMFWETLKQFHILTFLYIFLLFLLPFMYV